MLTTSRATAFIAEMACPGRKEYIVLWDGSGELCNGGGWVAPYIPHCGGGLSHE